MIFSFRSRRMWWVGVLSLFLLCGIIMLVQKRPFDRPCMASESHFARPVIVLDPGHGGMDGGAVGVGGVLEKDVNLAIALKVRTLLSLQGIHVVMTRERDVCTGDKDAVTLRDKKRTDILNRMALVERTPNAILVSIHQNQFPMPQYSGAQMFYGPLHPDSELLARLLQQEFRHLQPDNTREIKKSTDQVYLMYHAKVPAVLVECGFLSNEREAALLQQEDYQNKVAATVSAGVVEFLSRTNEQK